MLYLLLFVQPEPEPILAMGCGGDGGDGNYQLANVTFDGCLAPMNLSDPKLCVALDVHIYLFATLFLVLTITACFVLVQLIRNQSAKPAFMITINILVIIFGLMRALFLFIDAYGLTGRFKSVGGLLFADLAIPCLTSAFALIQWACLELLQMRRMNSALQKPVVLVAIVISHFIFIAAIDFMLFYIGKGVCFLMTVCQAVTVLWGFILTAGFLYTTQKLVHRDREHRITLKRTQYVFTNKQSTMKSSKNGETKSESKNGKNSYIRENNAEGNQSDDIQAISGQNVLQTQPSTTESNKSVDANVSVVTETNTESEPDVKPCKDIKERDSIIVRPLRRLRRTLKSGLSKSIIRKSYLTKVKNVGIFTTIIGIGLFSVSIYGIVAIYNPFDGAPQPDAWGWYIFQTVHRLVV